MIVEYDHPDVGKVRLPGNPIKMSGMDGTISHPAPRVGEHTDEVLGELLGLSGEQVEELRKKGGGEVSEPCSPFYDCRRSQASSSCSKSINKATILSTSK